MKEKLKKLSKILPITLLGVSLCGNPLHSQELKKVTYPISAILNEVEVSGRDKSGKIDNYTILQTEDEAIIINQGESFTLHDHNIETLLEAYQKKVDSVVFQHLFFEDGEFRYRLITEDGKKAFEMLGYDDSFKKLRDSLIDRENFSKFPKLPLGLALNGDSFSFNSNYFNLSAQGGIIHTDISSLNFFQAGYVKEFYLSNLTMTPNISFIIGEGIQGISGDLIFLTNKNKKINLSSRTSLIWLNSNYSEFYPLFYDLSNWTGTSYKFFPDKNIDVEPYFLAKLSHSYKDVNTLSPSINLNEIECGTNFNALLKEKVKLSVAPHYLKRIWEQEIGTKLSASTKNINLSLENYTTQSESLLCPNKSKLEIELDIFLNPLALNLIYKRDKVRYNGEKGFDSSFSIVGRIKK